MKAALVMQRRQVLAKDAFAEVVIWRLPQPLPPSEHGYKYRLAYVVDEKCVVRYDNERGKGDHRHFEAAESTYAFSSPRQLMQDFFEDVARWNHEHGHT